MDEAKALLQMSLSAIYSSMILAAVVGLIAVGYLMWGAFSRQDAANAKLADYANYTAFDNTTVRGQEVIQLLESNKDIFVVIYDGSSPAGNTSIDEMNIATTPLAKYVPDDVEVQDFKTGSVSTENSNKTCSNVLAKFKSANKQIKSLTCKSGINLAEATHSELIKYFTNGADTTMPLLGKPATSTSTDQHMYAAYKSVLVYSNDGTTDIIGIILVRESKNVEL